jgi:site-specific DNA-methyltransferase (adenine-specific)/modification methylase
MVESKLFNEDCLNTINKLRWEHVRDNKKTKQPVDLVVTSPPYNMNLRIMNGKYRSRQITDEFSNKYDGFTDNMPIDEYTDFHSSVLEGLLNISDLIFYNVGIVTGSKRAWFNIIGNFSDNLKEIIIWDKGNGQPAMQKQVLNRRSELILVFEKDYPISRQFRLKGTFDRGTLDDVWDIGRPLPHEKVDKHAAQMPEALVERILLNFSDEDDTIYDPFMGTGTTGAVAKRLNRNFIGSELVRNYYDAALQRIGC